MESVRRKAEVLKRCWLAQFSDRPCEGRWDKAHLISKQALKRVWAGTDLWDTRTWVWACRYHHANFDNYRLRVPREALPEPVAAFCAENELDWYLDRRFGVVDRTTD